MNQRHVPQEISVLYSTWTMGTSMALKGMASSKLIFQTGYLAHYFSQFLLNKIRQSSSFMKANEGKREVCVQSRKQLEIGNTKLVTLGGWWALPLFSNAELREWVECSCGSRKARGATGEAGELGVAFLLRRSQDQTSSEQIGV